VHIPRLGCCSYADQENPWLGPIPALVAAIAVAIAIAMEPRAWLRRLFLGLVVALHVLYIEESSHGDTWPSANLAVVTFGEAALIVLFVESRLWRWSLVPGIAMSLWLTLHLLPLGYASLFAMADGYRVSWLVHALLLLCANGGWRSINAELEEDRARSARSDV
jgi:hypothetical protein